MKFTISDADAERIGCSASLEFDERTIMAREAIVIKKATGLSIESIGRGLTGMPVLDADGNPQYVRDDDGAEVRDEFGHRSVLREVDMEAVLAAIWIAVRRTGVTVPWGEFDLDLLGISFGDDETTAEVVGEGKALKTTGTTSTS